MTGNLQADGVQSRQMLFVRYCHRAAPHKARLTALYGVAIETIEKVRTLQNLPIGEVLKEYGYITQEQIDQALQFQKTQSGKKVRFGTLLQEMGFVTETQVLEALGKKLDLQMVNLEEYEVNVDVVAKVPKQLAENTMSLPCRKTTAVYSSPCLTR